jgi:hypothetical protein
MPNLVNSANIPIQIGILPGIRPALFSLYEAKKCLMIHPLFLYSSLLSSSNIKGNIYNIMSIKNSLI